MGIKKISKSKYQIDYRDIRNRRIRKIYNTKYEAESALGKAIVDKNRGLSSVVNKDITVKDACEYFIESYSKNYCKQKTSDEYTRIIRKDIIPYFNDTKLHLLSKIQVEQFIGNIKQQRDLSNSTLNKYLTILSSIINKQVENGNIFQNIISSIKKYKETARKGRAFSEEEIKHILTTCKKELPDFYPMLYTAINTGMRRGELCALKWENIDFNTRKIHVEKSEYKGKLVEPKTETSNRFINMTPKLYSFLQELNKIKCDDIFVFPNSKGNMRDGNNVYNRWLKPLVKKCNIGNFRLHDFRHNYASYLTKISGDIYYVQHQLGHATPMVTMNTYGHLIPNKHFEDIDIIDSY